jgi:hypothetical protein
MGKEDRTNMRRQMTKQVFESPWCPLFGKLPIIDHPDSFLTQRCLQVITEARSICEVSDGSDLDSFPPPASVKNYANYKIDFARALFRVAPSVFLYATIENPNDDWVEYKNIWHKKSGADQVLKNVLSYSRNLTNSPAITKTKAISDRFIMALLAIYCAWDALRYLLPNDIQNESGKERTAEALGFLSEAKRLFSKDAGINEGKITGVKEKNTKAAQRPRPDSLASIMKVHIAKFEDPTPSDIWDSIFKEYENSVAHPVIQEMNEKEIFFLEKNGKEEKVSYSNFKKRVNRIREKK